MKAGLLLLEAIKNWNKQSKRSDAVVGNARKSHFFTQWVLIYHEILSVKNLHCEYTGGADYTFEGWQHNESSPSFTKKTETQIQKLIDYIEEKRFSIFRNVRPFIIL